ncbi:MAG: RimK family protein, partial [Opitutales bacterium]
MPDLDSAPQNRNSVPTENLIVVDHLKKWKFTVEDARAVSPRDYLSNESYRNSDRYNVLNLCNDYKTHTLGYYVSLLASARSHRVVPSVMTLKDISNPGIAQSVVDEIKDLIEEKLKAVSEPEIEFPVFLGQTVQPAYGELAKRLFALFEMPAFLITFSKKESWKLRKLTPLNLGQITERYPESFEKALALYFQKKRFRRAQLKSYKYDLAILADPDEKTPPSSPEALAKFRKAAEKVGFFTEMINKLDYRRICEFDALFIRETTAIEHHTYKFARHAHTEGLVVIDDPWSILRCSNKVYLHERLARARIRQPKSWLFTKGADLTPQLPGLSYPLVLKLPESSFSQGVHRVADESELKERLSEMFGKGDLVIAQEFLKSDFDWRIGVMDGNPLFACKYYMANEHWQIYNWSESGDSDEFEGRAESVPVNQVPAPILSAAVRASGLIGDSLYGVDLKEVNGQPYVIEINDNPNIDAGVEDVLLGDELYLRIMTSFYNRIERERNEPR